MITNEELTKIKERAEKATAGPWGIGEQYEQMDPGHYVYSESNGYIVVAEEEGTFGKEDAQFIAYSREDVPRLVAEVERLKSAIDNAADYISIGESAKANDFLCKALGVEANYYGIYGEEEFE